MRLDEKNTMVFPFFLSFSVQKVFAKKLIIQKATLFRWPALGRPKCDLWQNVTKMCTIGYGLIQNIAIITSVFVAKLYLHQGANEPGKGWHPPPPRCGLGWRNRRCGRGLRAAIDNHPDRCRMSIFKSVKTQYLWDLHLTNHTLSWQFMLWKLDVPDKLRGDEVSHCKQVFILIPMVWWRAQCDHCLLSNRPVPGSLMVEWRCLFAAPCL